MLSQQLAAMVFWMLEKNAMMATLRWETVAATFVNLKFVETTSSKPEKSAMTATCSMEMVVISSVS